MKSAFSSLQWLARKRSPTHPPTSTLSPTVKLDCKKYHKSFKSTKHDQSCATFPSKFLHRIDEIPVRTLNQPLYNTTLRSQGSDIPVINELPQVFTKPGANIYINSFCVFGFCFSTAWACLCHTPNKQPPLPFQSQKTTLKPSFDCVWRV